MNYTFRINDQDLTDPESEGSFLGVEFLEESLRPQLGQELVLPNVSKSVWRVVRVDPVGNPTGQTNTYFLDRIR